MFQGLRTTIYHVTDLARATEWYTQLVGHPPYFNEPFYVGFNVGGYELGLLPDDADTADTYWGTPNIDEELARLNQLGATTLHPIQDVGGDIRVASVKDPFGNTIGIIENPHFKLETP
ncbi:MAG: VOC family protein [Betaproteobacteria bacterium]|nr:VOC family protein [Betaproteobacteria bacterium]